MSIVLASGSPRRKELLEMLGIEDMKIIPAKGEEIPPEGAGPAELVVALATAKGREVAAQCAADDVIIAAGPPMIYTLIRTARSSRWRASPLPTGACSASRIPASRQQRC